MNDGKERNKDGTREDRVRSKIYCARNIIEKNKEIEMGLYSLHSVISLLSLSSFSEGATVTTSATA